MLSKNSLRKIAFWSVSIVLMLSLILGVGLYYLLWTTSGSRFVLEKAKDLASDYVQLDVQIKEGSIGNGFISSGPIKVNVPKIVSVKAESLSSKWSLFRYLTSGTLTVDYIKAPRLEVALANELFLDNEDSEGLSEDRTEDLQIQNSNEPFRLNIPLKAVINHLYAQDFAFLSPIVDVFIGELDLDRKSVV